MLDQNTDRMWFVIGAVIVGAAIIFIANGTLPELFASVTDSFEEASDKGLAVADAIGTPIQYDNPNNVVETSNPTYYKGQKIVNGQIVNNTGPNWWSTIGYLPVEGGVRYSFNVPLVVRDPQIAYYDENKVHIGTISRGGNLSEVIVTLPDKARYVAIAAGDVAVSTNPNNTSDVYSPVSDWVFEQVSIDE